MPGSTKNVFVAATSHIMYTADCNMGYVAMYAIRSHYPPVNTTDQIAKPGTMLLRIGFDLTVSSSIIPTI